MLIKNLIYPFILMDEDEKGGSGGNQNQDKQENNQNQNQIDWSKVNPNDIPENLINQHPAHKRVVDESIDRRKKISALNKQLDELNGQENQEDTTKTEEQNKNEVPAWAQEIMNQFKSLQTSNLAGWRELAGKATGLKGAILNKINGNSYDEVLTEAKSIATELGIQPPILETGNVGNPAQERDKGFQEKVRNRMINRDAINSFDPDVQRNLGGGVMGFDN